MIIEFDAGDGLALVGWPASRMRVERIPMPATVLLRGWPASENERSKNPDAYDSLAKGLAGIGK